MYWEQTVEYAALSDIGLRRTNNQDSCAVRIAPDREMYESRGHLFVVADGMGGHAVGELASRMATDVIPHTYAKLVNLPMSAALQQSLVEANSTIYNRALQNQDFLSMGTTCTSLALTPQGAIAAHVGDSRLYRVRGGLIEQLTFDHSVQWELARNSQVPVDPKMMMEYRNVITRSLGPHPSVQVDVEGPYTVQPGDKYLLCSDGLSGLVSDEEIGMACHELPPAEACQMLVDLANLRGGSDNITVVVVRVGDVPPGLPPASSTTMDAIQEEAPEPGWGWFTALCGHAALFFLAITMIALGRVVEGLLMLGLVLIVAGGLFVAWMRIFGTRQQNEATARRLAQPYRQASAQFNPRFLTQLMSLEMILQQTTREAGWAINWQAYNECMQRAQEAWQRHDIPATMRNIAHGLRRLLSQIQSERRKGIF
ncbi:MAG: protein phosphatase 2C domain-containing protein [Planctomycetales bacterium]